MKLETKRLILRKPRASDWQDIVEGASEYDVARMTKTIPHPYTKEDAVWFIDHMLKTWGKDNYTFFIELRSEKKVIGALGLTGVNEYNGTAKTGSWINKKYWRRGYMTEAKIAVNDFAFNELRLRRIESTVHLDNNASNATQQKMGYKHEGIKRKATRSRSNGKIHDLNLYGLLKEDWRKARKGCIEWLKHYE
jgi:RimJ/RimL family protein N-acetyltransferase